VRTIHRYPLALGLNRLSLPEHAQVLSAHAKDGEPQLWALVDSKAMIVPRAFYVAATGENLPDVVGDFVGTVLIGTHAMGTLVLHVFDVTRSRT
jgi:hypothetical protein